MAVVLSILVALLLAARLHLVFRLNFNWDEFHYLSFIYDWLRSAPLGMQQTFHVHLFSWLPGVAPADEITQITIARSVVWALGLGSSLLLYLIGRRFLSVEGSLFALLCYAATSNVLRHAASFRPDPLLTLLVLIALWVVISYPTSRLGLLAAALALALAAMLSPKTIFFLPTLVAIQWLQSRETAPGRRVRWLALFALSTAAWWWILRLFHRGTLHTADLLGSEIDSLGTAGRKVLWTGSWFPQGWDLARTLDRDKLVWALLAFGVASVLWALRSATGSQRVRALCLLTLALPLLTVAFYRNSFPYYYVAILAFPAVLCGVAFDRLRRLHTSPRLRTALTWLLIVGVAWTGLAHSIRLAKDEQQGQRMVLAAVHRMFPEPVPYIDRCSMVSSFPKVGFFMSTWGFDSYLGRQLPQLSTAIEEQAPPLLVANVAALDLRVPEAVTARTPNRLLPEDARSLRENYVHHWGILFVAGKHVVTGDRDQAEFTILIPGTYTVESSKPVEIDGLTLFPGASLELSRGDHLLGGPAGTMLTLRWGTNLYRPDSPPPDPPIFLGL